MAKRKIRMTKVNGEIWYSIGDISERIHGNRSSWYLSPRYNKFRENTVVDIHPSTDNLMRFMSPYDILKALAVPYDKPKQQLVAEKLAEQISNRLDKVEESREAAGVKVPSVYEARSALYDEDDTSPVFDLDPSKTYTGIGDEAEVKQDFTHLYRNAITINTNTNAQKEHNMAPANTVHPPTDNQIFNFEGQNVRTVTIDNEPWFNLGDVCKVMELDNVARVKNRLDQLNLTTSKVQNSRGQMRDSAFVNESGLYDVILDSRKPQAKEFRRWITSEVIPSIRKTGTYSIEQVQDQFQLPTNYVEALEALVVAEKDKIELTEKNEQLVLDNLTLDTENYDLSLENSKLKPLAEEYQHLMDSNGTFSMMDVAKILDVGRTTLFKFLREEKILMSQGSNKNVPYQRYKKHFRVTARRWEDSKGQNHVGKTTYVYPEGLNFIAKRVRKAGLNA